MSCWQDRIFYTLEYFFEYVAKPWLETNLGEVGS